MANIYDFLWITENAAWTIIFKYTDKIYKTEKTKKSAAIFDGTDLKRSMDKNLGFLDKQEKIPDKTDEPKERNLQV